MATTLALNDRLYTAVDTITKDTVYKMDFPCEQYTVQIAPTGGTATVYTSNDNLSWIKWDLGDVLAPSADTCYAVRFIKITLVTATSVDVGIRGI